VDKYLVKEENFTISIEGTYLLIKTQRSPDMDQAIEDLLKIRDAVKLTKIKNLVFELDIDGEISMEFMESFNEKSEDLDKAFMYEVKAAFLVNKSSLDKFQILDAFNRNQNLQTRIFVDLDEATNWLDS